MNESSLRPLCEEVDKYFQLPPDRRYCYFAVTEDAYLATEIGRYFRGALIPTSSKGEIPDYALNRYLPCGSTNYDYLIYIRDRTCVDPTGCVVTYAHELQHSVQHGRFPKLAAAGWVLYGNLAKFEPTATEMNLPTEIDANIVSKQVAEEVCGVKSVRRFAEQQVLLMRREAATPDAAAQVIRWEFFLNVPSSTPYDFVDETVKLVQKYEKHMDFRMDVSVPGWWKGPLVEDPPAGPL